jgi:hypothetical protein
MIAWPCAPMLNRPARNGIATAKPVRISGAALVSVSEIGRSTACHVAMPQNQRFKVSGLTMAPLNMSV